MRIFKFLVMMFLLLISSTCFAQYVPDPNIWKEYFPPNKKGTVYYAPEKTDYFPDGAYTWILWAENSDKDIYHVYRWRLFFPEKYMDMSYYKKVNGKTGKILTEQDHERDYQAGYMQRNQRHYTFKYYKGYERMVEEAYEKWLEKFHPTDPK